MPPRCQSSLRHRARATIAFTLVEVVTALAVFLVAIMGLVGLLLTSLQTQHTSIEQARAMETLRKATTAIYSQQLSGTTYYMTNGFPGGATNTSLAWHYGGSSVNLTPFTVPAPDNNGQIMFVRIVPPASHGQPLGVYLSVAWPATATTTAGTWINAQGFQDTYLTVMPPN